MKDEISAATLFLSKLVRGSAKVTDDAMSKFEKRLKELLEERYRNHWHPERPWQGQGYRCLRMNNNTRKEPTIEQAARDCGLKYNDLKLPVELTIWVDPEEVCCRFGEQKGSCFTIASFGDSSKENSMETRACPTYESVDVLKERNVDSCNVQSPPSSTQSTPAKSYSRYGKKDQTSPTRSTSDGNTENRSGFINYQNQHNYCFMSNPNNLHQKGYHSPPYYRNRQCPELPLQFFCTTYVYQSTTPPHYVHSQMPPPVSCSPPNVAPRKLSRNANSYTHKNKPKWFGHRVMTKV
ncbi:BTG3-like [Homarus americanus]|uniref:BTG3-like n=1 Tax=Homarus americanus TaxID=6706 RepID=A0A8J5JKD9_HOMAM|nr:BTG3-like [Homarus americanus]